MGESMSDVALPVTFDPAAKSYFIPVEGWNKKKAYRLHLAIVREDDDQISAISINLPGVVGCGATEEEAIASIRGAAMATIESYQSESKDIPWQNSTSDDIPAGANQKWILVNV
jgi:predicted RNase H-like HicB family nuclease